MTSSTLINNHEQKLKSIIHSNHYIRDVVQRNIIDFLNLREKILTTSGIQGLTAYNEILFPLTESPRIEQLNARITSDKVQLAFCGENSSGKTAFLHTFLGIGKILPSGDGPVTARITKLTYASGEHACIRIRKTIGDQTLNEEEVDLSPFFATEKPNWMNVGRTLAKYLKRPQEIDESSAEFAEWSRCFVEIHIPSPTLALGIDVYDTPGFLSDDALVLKEILHDLVERIHPTIVFMYANPSTDDATKGCFLAMKTALYDLDSTSIFFLNSKTDINQMSKFKQGMSVDEFHFILSEERAHRYSLLLRSPLLANNKLEGLPTTVDQCHCFDICSVNSQSLKTFGPLMNETTIQRIIQFVANNDLAVATRACKLALPIIDAFFDLLLITSHRTPEHLLQLHHDAMNWENMYFGAYSMYTERCLLDLFSNIFQRFSKEEESIVQRFLDTTVPLDSLELTVQTDAKFQIITPALRDTLRQFMGYILEHIASNYDLTHAAVFNEILIRALGRQEISDFVAELLGDHITEKSISASILYMVNTVSTPILQCAQYLQNLNFSNGASRKRHLAELHDESHVPPVNSIVRVYLLDMQKVIDKERRTMRQAVMLWGDQQKAVLRSLIDTHYRTASPLLDSHQETLKYLTHDAWRFIVIECELSAAQNLAKFNDIMPDIREGDSKSTVFSIFTADWGDEKNLLVKKLSRSLPDQPNAAYYEAHYHRKVANLFHPNIINLRYLHVHHFDNGTSELWMIFPPMSSSLEQFLQTPSISLSIKIVLEWMNGIADALAVLHGNELVHRNIVLSNIVLTEDKRIMLIDLGNWHESCDLSLRHDPAMTINGTNDDIKAFGDIGHILSTFIEQDEKVSAIIDEFNELILKCLDASHMKPVTAEFVRQRLRFILDMF